MACKNDPGRGGEDGKAGAIIRWVYGLLVRDWLEYMHYLKSNFPYLFSLAMRVNPFDETASAIVG